MNASAQKPSKAEECKGQHAQFNTDVNIESQGH